MIYFLAGADRNVGSMDQESDSQSAVLLTWKPSEEPLDSRKEDADNCARKWHRCETDAHLWVAELTGLRKHMLGEQMTVGE